MIFLKCKICGGEIDILECSQSSIYKKVQCRCCGFSNIDKEQYVSNHQNYPHRLEQKYPEVIIVRKPKINDQ